MECEKLTICHGFGDRINKVPRFNLDSGCKGNRYPICVSLPGKLKGGRGRSHIEDVTILLYLST